ncbi:MAG: PilN domain-containing protein [Sedimenticola sp.]
MNIRDFLTWWLGQLSELVPIRWRQPLQPKARVLNVEVERQQLTISAYDRKQRHDCGPINLADCNPACRDQLTRFLEELPARPSQVTLRLAPDTFLTCELDLPLSAENDLHETVGYQISRLTPFFPDQVTYHCGIVERNPAEQQLTAWLACIPHKTLNGALSLLQSLDIEGPGQLRNPAAEDEALEIDYRTAGGTQRWAPKTLAIAGGTFLPILIAVGILHTDNRLTTLDLLREQLSVTRQQAKGTSRLVDEFERRKRQASALTELKRRNPLLVAVLDDITQRLDDGTWLLRFYVNSDKLTLQGTSDNASNLIGQLEDSPMLQDVRFVSSITRTPSDDGDRFHISAGLINDNKDGDDS